MQSLYGKGCDPIQPALARLADTIFYNTKNDTLFGFFLKVLYNFSMSFSCSLTTFNNLSGLSHVSWDTFVLPPTYLCLWFLTLQVHLTHPSEFLEGFVNITNSKPLKIENVLKSDTRSRSTYNLLINNVHYRKLYTIIENYNIYAYCTCFRTLDYIQ